LAILRDHDIVADIETSSMRPRPRMRGQFRPAGGSPPVPGEPMGIGLVAAVAAAVVVVAAAAAVAVAAVVVVAAAAAVAVAVVVVVAAGAVVVVPEPAFSRGTTIVGKIVVVVAAGMVAAGMVAAGMVAAGMVAAGMVVPGMVLVKKLPAVLGRVVAVIAGTEEVGVGSVVVVF
jgi:hypothetical protein